MLYSVELRDRGGKITANHFYSQNISGTSCKRLLESIFITSHLSLSLSLPLSLSRSRSPSISLAFPRICPQVLPGTKLDRQVLIEIVHQGILIDRFMVA